MLKGQGQGHDGVGAGILPILGIQKQSPAAAALWGCFCCQSSDPTGLEEQFWCIHPLLIMLWLWENKPEFIS